MREPRVSIGLPVRNGQRYLRSAIASILIQDFDDFELIVGDNASEDDTASVCRELAGRDPRIRYHRSEVDIGIAGNFNKVFHLARGRYFKWHAYDDECHPEMIGRCVRALDAAPESVAMVYPLAELIDAEGRTVKVPLDRIGSCDLRPHRRLARLLWSLSMCDPLFGLMKTEYLRRTRLIGAFFGGDYVLLGELAMRGQIREVDEVLFRLRTHDLRSMKVHTTARARATFYDAACARKLFILPSWERVVLELLRAVGRSGLPVGERVKCYLAVAGSHYARRSKDLGGRWKSTVGWSLRRAVRLAPAGAGLVSREDAAGSGKGLPREI